MIPSSAPSTPPPVRPWELLRLAAAPLGAMARAVARRLLGRAVWPAWPARLEIAVAAYRGTWSLMPTLGMVRWRQLSEAASPLLTRGLTPEDAALPAAPGARAVWMTPPDADGPVLLYFHGGGFVFGSLRTHGDLIGGLARAARARTLALLYRLAPEHPAPAAIEDAVGAYAHLLSQGIPPGRIVLGGDSAGGNLVLTTLLRLRDAGLPLPAAGVAISPWVDLGCSGESFDTYAAVDFVGRIHCQMAADAFLAGADPRRPDLSPLYADLRGLPPLLIQAGGVETLVDQIRAFAHRAQAAGVDVTLSVWPDMPHVWHMLRHITPAGQGAIDEVGAFVRARAG